MRSTLVLLACATTLTAACLSTPRFDGLDETTNATSPSSQAAADSAAPALTSETDAATTADATEPADAAEPEEDAAVIPPEPPPPPPSPTCPPTGSPAGSLCCGAGNTPPLCVGLACEHCSECVAKGCGGGTSVCCAIASGKGKDKGKYKGMTCALPALSGLCP